MGNELAPDGPDLQPDLMGDFAGEEAGSEEASHLLPAIRPLPAERQFAPGAYFAIQAAGAAPAQPPQTFGEKLGESLFQSLTDVHLFGRNADNEPWLEVEAHHPETAQVLIAQELLPASGEPLTVDDLEMFEMVAGRVAKTLKREKLPVTETLEQASARSARLATQKGRLGKTYSLAVAGSLDAGKVADAALSLGLKRAGDHFAWHGRVGDESTFTVHADGGLLAPGAQGAIKRLEFRFTPARVSQPAKVLERMFTACQYFIRRAGGSLQSASGGAPPEGLVRGEDPALAAIVAEVEATGLPPGNVVTRRLA